MSQRIFVTGMGVVSPLGLGVKEFWQNLCIGKHKFGTLPAIYPGMKSGFCAGLLQPNDKLKLKSKVEGHLGFIPPDSSLYAISALLEALIDAGLQPKETLLKDALVVLGNSEGQTDLIDQRIENEVSAWEKHTYASHSISDQVAGFIGTRGPAFVIHNTCASANVAIEFAEAALRSGMTDIAVVGGSDSFSLKVWSGFSTLGAVGPLPCAPFSKSRKFITISEGSAILILQNERALKRGQTIYAELLGASSCNDAQQPTNPDLAGVLNCHQKVIAKAGLQMSDIDLIYAHGTGTRSNDSVEAEIFANYYPKAKVTGIKGTVGHLMATAGAIGAVASVLSLREQFIPPTAIARGDLEFPISLVVMDEVSPPGRIQFVQNNSFGFGGNNAISIFSRWTQ
jgi:3-oxoacyl-[acyl-carrier-protein] synthase II